MSRIPRIRPQKLRGRTGRLVTTPYDEVFLEQLRAMVPKGDRWFNEFTKGWWIAEQHADVVEHLVRECFGHIELVDEAGESITVTRAGERLLQERLL